MLRYELTAAAQEDIKEIARYALTQWASVEFHAEGSQK